MSFSKYNSSLTLEYLKNVQENSYFDRKSAKIDVRKLANIIASFANANGGTIALGVEDNGNLSGIKCCGDNKSNDFLKIISNNYFKNLPVVNIESIDVINIKNEKDNIFLYHIEPSLNRIIRNVKDEVYLRQGDSSNKLSNEQIKLLEYERNESVFEDELVRRATLDDIDEEIVNLYKQKLNTNLDTQSLLKARKFLIKDHNNEYLTNAGVLLFSKDPSLFLPSARVRIIKIEGIEMQTGTEMNVIKDVTFALPLYKCIYESKKFIETQLREFSHLGPDGKFVKVPEYPEFAWVEGLVNAVTHRDYSVSGEHIKIILYDDRIEIISPGKLPALITLNTMKTERYSRNPQISRVLTDLGVVRELNEGVKRIYKEMQEFFLDEPEYSEPNNRYVKLVLKNNIIMRSKRKVETLLKKEMLNDKWTDLNLMEQKILQAIHDRGKITIKELSEMFNRDRRTIQRLMKKLEKQDIIIWVGTSIKDPQKYYQLK